MKNKEAAIVGKVVSFIFILGVYAASATITGMHMVSGMAVPTYLLVGAGVVDILALLTVTVVACAFIIIDEG